MGRIAKSKRAAKRRAARSEAKAQKKKRYAEFALRGNNSKRKRRSLKKSRWGSARRSLTHSPCGNVACSRCHPGHMPTWKKLMQLRSNLAPTGF